MPKDLEIPLDLDEATRKKIRDSYSDGINSYVRGWSDEAVDRLRNRVEEQVAQGFRADRMADILKAEYGVTESRAKLIARQETGTLVAKYRQTRYEAVGIKKYIWSTSLDERVRPDHRVLNCRIFSFDDPPITDRATGRRNNPGEDFRCFPGDSKVDLAYGIEKCFRRWYTGESTTIILNS